LPNILGLHVKIDGTVFAAHMQEVTNLRIHLGRNSEKKNKRRFLETREYMDE
jgi:hypothetical protein